MKIVSRLSTAVAALTIASAAYAENLMVGNMPYAAHETVANERTYLAELSAEERKANLLVAELSTEERKANSLVAELSNEERKANFGRA
ncbi:hypothetical protein [Roseovarius sp. D0-M9]|uniref:hypothetical protein n=1 Tax=Roseovarius sp. D0-M9 TaxID=3127117 RepID=UPI00301050CE